MKSCFVRASTHRRRHACSPSKPNGSARCARWPMSPQWQNASGPGHLAFGTVALVRLRSEAHTAELQSLMRISYAVFCLLKKRRTTRTKISDILVACTKLIRSVTFDAGVETIRAEKGTIVDEIMLRQGGDPTTSTRLITVEAEWQREMRSLSDVSAMAERFGTRASRLRNGRSGKVALQIPARTRLTDAGEAVATWQLHRPGHHQSITAGDLEESMWEPVDAETFGDCWTAECDELGQNPHRERFFLAKGRLLPIWNLLGDDPAVRRLVTADGRALLGRIVPHGDVNPLLGKLGITGDRKSTRLNSSHQCASRMPSSA